MAKTSRPKNSPQRLYDRLADIQNLAMKLNGYRASVAKYLKSLRLELGHDALVLDAGSGTGIITLGFLDTGIKAKRVVALDLSLKSLLVARDEFDQRRSKITETVQSDVLRMPFADNTFDLVLMCGVLEYTPIDVGLAEAARVMKRGARLVFIPIKPSVVGAVLELLYNFRTHSPESVRKSAEKYFTIVGNHKFPITQPMSWSKTIFLLEKK